MLLDLRGKSPVTEFFLIATGTSPRQMRTAVDEIRDLGKANGFAAWRQDGYESAKWIVLDCVTLVAHLFDEESRDFYDLELLWGDSPRIDWRKELGLPPQAELPPEEVAEDDETYEEEDASVVVEVPDESTGSNSVEFVEAGPPTKRGRKGNAQFPVEIEEEEDTTLEEQAMGPMSEVADAIASIDEEVEEIESQPTRKAKKPAPKKKAAAKKAVQKTAKKTAKKAPTKKPAAKKKSSKKAAPKKAAAKKKPAGKSKKK